MAKNEITYKVKLDAEIQGLTSKLNTLKSAMATALNSNQDPKLNKTIVELEDRLQSLITKVNTPIHGKGAFAGLEKELSSIKTLSDATETRLQKLLTKDAKKQVTFLPKDERKRIEGILSLLKNVQTLQDNSIKASETLAKNQAEVNRQEEERTRLLAKQDALQQKLNDNSKNQDKLKATAEVYEKNGWDKRSSYTQDGVTYNYRQDKKAVMSEDEIANTKAAINEAKSSITAYNGTIATLKRTIESLSQALVNNSTKFKEYSQQAQAAGVSLDGISSELTNENTEILTIRLQELANQGLIPFITELQTALGVQQEFNSQIDQTEQAVEKEKEAFIAQDNAAGQVEGLMSRIKQFTGLTGAALVMRRAMNNAITTIRELDKQMTQMAVVTDLQVGDYWKQLPEHTERANALGMAIKDVYEAETLYYQQGLKTAEVTQLATSTLKMARIAGLSAEDATNKMTAALRGFNMEIDQTNADRIADVYSKLAAITASDVQEISTAMTRTASLAHNAGMEFETTAAFLSQIIETTRESAETAGTALKTVIARFQELKKSPDEIGEVEGEIVDANKIETALRSVDVALRDSAGQFRALDEVFLELASKWDTLDTNTQRYIATIAAGSRQQSRFIAMMSDYARTQELVNAANNAAGASNEQFQKTLDSLESKFAALKNAWDTFTMGLVNNEFIKHAIDILTQLLDALNQVSKGFGAWSSSAIKIGMVTAALIAGDKALSAFRKSMAANNGVLKSFGNALKSPVQSLKDFITRLKQSPVFLKNNRKELINYQTALKNTKTAEDNVKKALEAKDKALKAQRQAQLAANKAHGENAILNEKLAKAQEDYKKETQNLVDVQKLSESEAGHLTDTQNALMMSYKLTDEQMAEALAINKMGVPLDEASAMAKQGVTAATYEKAVAEGTENKLQEKYNETGLRGLLVRLGTKAAILAEKLGLGGLLPVKAADIAATKGQEAANWSLWASLWPILLVMLAIGAAIAIVIGLFALFQALAKESPEGRLQAANEALAEASENAKNAKDAYDELNDSLKTLDEQYEALENMAEGTREWREALLEVNGQVLDLINKYPELAKYVSNEGGILKISDEGREAALDEQLKTVAQTQAMQAMATSIRDQASINAEFAKLSDKAIHGNEALAATLGALSGSVVGTLGPTATVTQGISGAVAYGAGSAASWASALGSLGGPIGSAIVGGIQGADISRALNRKVTEDFAKALAGGEIATNEELREYLRANDLEDWLSDIGDISSDTAKELAKYGAQLKKVELAREQEMQTMINSAVTMVDTSKYTQEQIKQMSNIGTDYMEKQLQYIQAEFNKYSEKQLDEKDSFFEQYWENIYRDMEVDIQHGAVMIKENGKWVEKLSKEQAAAQYEAAQAVEDTVNRIERLPIALAKGGKALTKAFDDDQGKALSRSNLTDLTKEELQKIWEENAELREIFHDNEEDFLAEMNKRTAEAASMFKKNAKELQRLGLDENTFADLDIEAGAEKALADHLAQIMAISGETAVKQVVDLVNSTVPQLGEKEKQIFLQQLNALDWHDADALMAFPDLLKSLGVHIPTAEMETFIETLHSTAGAIRKVDLTKLNENLLEIGNIVEELKGKTQGRKFESDLYEQLIEMNPALKSQFSANKDGSYTYLGNSMQDLIVAIEKYTTELIEAGSTQYANKLGVSDLLTAMIGDGTKKWAGTGSVINMANTSNWTQSESRQFISEVLRNAQEQGISVNGISEYLSDKTEVVELSDKQVDSIIDSFKGLYGQRDSLTKEMFNELATAYASSAQINPAWANIGANLSAKATRGALDNDEVSQYRGSRMALLDQAQMAGLSEQDVKRVHELHNTLNQLEDDYQTHTKEYKEASAQWQKYSRLVAGDTGFQQMRTGLTDFINNNKELIDSYKQTNSELQKIHLTEKMMQEFNINVTAGNYNELAELIDKTLQGETEAFEQIINYAGQAAGLSGDVYNTISKAIFDEMESNTKKFAQAMLDQKKAYINEFGEFIWGTEELIDLTDELIEKTEKWISKYDWLYNANSRINAQLKQRELLEKQFERLIDEQKGSMTALTDNIQQQIGLLQANTNANQSKYRQAGNDLTAYMNQINNNPLLAGLRDVIAVGPGGQIAVDKEKLYSVDYDTETGGVIEEMIGKIEEAVDTRADAVDAINDNVDDIKELAKTGKDQYSDLLERVRSALEKNYQDQIDRMNTINEAINDAATSLTNKLQEQIEESRQIKENTKKEEDIANKQTRLSYLRASGGSALDILKLEKEISDAQEQYQDTLVDQSINKLQKDNQKASDQRQKQIEIAQTQLDYWKEFDSSKEAEKLLEESLAQIRTGAIEPFESEMGKLLSRMEGFENMASVAQGDWKDALDSGGKLAALYTEILDDQSDLGKSMAEALKSIAGAADEVTKDFSEYKAGKTTLLNDTENFTSSANDLAAVIKGWTETLTKALHKFDDDGNTDNNDKKDNPYEYTAAENKEALKFLSMAYDKKWTVEDINDLDSEAGKAFADLIGTIGDKAEATGGSWVTRIDEALRSHSKDYGTDGFKTTEPVNEQRAEATLDTTTSLDKYKNDLKELYSQGGQAYSNNFMRRAAANLTEDELQELLEYEKTLHPHAPLSTSKVGSLSSNMGFTQDWYDSAQKTQKEGVGVFKIGDYWYPQYAVQKNGSQLWLPAGTPYYKFASGGLADFTGPAWLDGTKSNPEMVLNSIDTANLISLKDILADILRNVNDTGSGSGSNYYDIKIDVDSIDSDYGVDRAAERIKELIEDDARYRNVNAVEKTR